MVTGRGKYVTLTPYWLGTILTTLTLSPGPLGRRAAKSDSDPAAAAGGSLALARALTTSQRPKAAELEGVTVAGPEAANQSAHRARHVRAAGAADAGGRGGAGPPPLRPGPV